MERLERYGATSATFAQRHLWSIMVLVATIAQLAQAYALKFHPPVVRGVTEWLVTNWGIDTEAGIYIWAAFGALGALVLLIRKANPLSFMIVIVPTFGYALATIFWAREFSAWQAFITFIMQYAWVIVMVVAMGGVMPDEH